MLVHTIASPRLVGERQPRLQIGDIFRRFGPAYRQQHHVTNSQAKVMRAIETCRTPLLGGHRRVCLDCGHQVDELNSCRNRHCPTCQALPQAKWIAKRQQRVLPVRHFHGVSTLPAQLRPIAHLNREHIFALLLRTTANALLELGKDPERLGVQLGITVVLHTWTRELQFHPHVHCVITAGGLAVSGSSRWVHITGDFLFPVRVFSRLFQRKFLAGLDELYKEGKLTVPARSKGVSPDAAFQSLKDELYDLEWHTYFKKPFDGAQHVFKYLGRYTHRVAISNPRLIDFDDDGVCFATKDGNSITLKPEQFIRRFLMHVLPDRFVKIRHYGLMASSNVNGRLEIARALLTPANADTEGTQTDQTALEQLPWEELLLRLTGIDLRVCPACGGRNLRRYRITRPRHAPFDTS